LTPLLTLLKQDGLERPATEEEGKETSQLRSSLA